MPAIWQGLIAPLDIDPDEFERRLYMVRRRAEKRADSDGIRMYIPSLSSRTLVYKGLMAGTRLADFYLDLKDPGTESRLSAFHQPYSANPTPDWRTAPPCRWRAHN